MSDMKQLTPEQAIEFGKSKAWEKMTAKERAAFQLEQECLCMPFDVFHKAIEEALGRPVWTHEFGLNMKGLREELAGKVKAPTFAEIMNLIPKDKRIILMVKDKEDKD